MACSEARVRANRLNAQASTGPRTAEGKAASRANSYRHGLSGSGVVAAEGDRAAAERLADELDAELRPRTALGSILVGRLAVLAVRMDRCGHWESASLAGRVRDATARFDDGRADEADARYAELFDPARDPNPLLRKLRRTPEGLARLLEGWDDLAGVLRQPELSPWGEAHLRAMDALSGRRPTDLAPSRAATLARVLDGGDLAGLAPGEAELLAPLAPEARAAWARDRLIERISEAVADLEAARGDLDLASIELDRAAAPALALFDPSREATLARKYEAAAERGFYRALREFQVVESQARAAIEPVPTAPVPPPARPGLATPAEAAPPRGSLGSFFPEAGPAPAVEPAARIGRAERPEQVIIGVRPASPGANPELAGAGSPSSARIQR